MAFAQSNTSPKEATFITKAEVQEVQKLEPPATDQTIKTVDIGKLNESVGVIHRGALKLSPDGLANVLIHHEQTESYLIISGGGTLVTGGTMLDPKESAKDSQGVMILNGPTASGKNKDGLRRVVETGDIIIIPAGVCHGWAEIPDHVDYLSFRPDPDRALPAGYVNPAIKK